jgi:hypothetical protein
LPDGRAGGRAGCDPPRGPAAIEDCTNYNFSHYDEGGILFGDSATNLNSFQIQAKGKK